MTDFEMDPKKIEMIEAEVNKNLDRDDLRDV